MGVSIFFKLPEWGGEIKNHVGGTDFPEGGDHFLENKTTFGKSLKLIQTS